MKLIANDPILTSIEDTDAYYDHMAVVVKRVKPALVRERYYNRDPDFRHKDGFESALREQIDYLTDLRLTQEEFDFKRKIQPWLPLDYLLWKRDSFRFKREYIHIKMVDGRLDLMTEGPEDEVIHYETPLLTIISRLNNLMFNGQQVDYNPNWKDNLRKDYDQMYAGGVNWIDFGARRRAGYDTEDYVCQLGKEYSVTATSSNGFRGTSNVHFAHKYDLNIFGTYPHKYVQYNMALYGPRTCNERAMFHWADTYGGKLGIALTDTVTTPVFLKDFNYKYAKFFDGVRQDSGDPSEIAEMIINHYEKLGIDPTQKLIVFSDGLDPGKAVLLTQKFRNRIKVTCGIGTRLTHNVGLKPMNHVIKASEFNFGDRWIGVCKLSDSRGKYVGHPADIAVTKHECGIESLNTLIF